MQNTIKALVLENTWRQTFRRVIATPGLGLIAAGAMICCGQPFKAFAVDDADATTAYDSFNAAFLNSSGNGYKTSVSDSSYDYFWQQAEDIELAEDRYEHTQSSTDKSLVNTLCTHFIATYPEPWTWDNWNDDLGRASEMLARGYLITGTADFLTKAKYGFNLAYGRGWNTTHNGGGIYEEQGVSNPEKEALSTLNCGYAAALIYQANGDQTYRSEAGDIYAWARSHIFNPSTGLVYTGVYTNGTVDTTPQVYNQGTMIDYARVLYDISGNSQYFNDANAAVIYTKANLTDSSGFITSCAPQFSRGMGHFVVENNLWNTTFSSGTTYYDWMYDNCNTGWGHRWTTYDITWNKINTQTPSETTLTPNQCDGVPSLLQYTFMPH
jgi:hypothetical protein